MYSRFVVWQEDPQVSAGELDFVNEFTVLDESIDIRFLLKGYGYKPNPTDENLDIYHFGSYRCYYRKQGDLDWILFARAVSERAESDVTNVYADIHVSTGLIENGVYEIKVVAADAEEYSSWGGTLEGIASGDTFWSGLEARQAIPYKLTPIELITAGESVVLGLNPLPLFVIDNEDLPTRVQDVLPSSSPLIGYLIGQDYGIFEAISITEYRLIQIISNISHVENISVTESIAFFSTLIQNHSPVDNITAAEDFFAYIFPFYMFFFEAVAVNEVAVVGFDEMFLPIFFDDVAVEDFIELSGLPPWPIRYALENILADDELPDIGNPASHWYQRLGMFKYELVHYDTCDDFNFWAVSVNGGNSLSSAGGQFVFTWTGGGGCSMGNIFTGIQQGVPTRKWQFVEFDLQFDNVYSSDQQMLVHFGQYIYIYITYNHGTGIVKFVGDSAIVSSTIASKTRDMSVKKRIRLEIVRQGNQYSRFHLCDVFIDSEFIARLPTQNHNLETDGQIHFAASGFNPAIFYVDNIRFGNLRGRVNSDILLFVKEMFSDFSDDPISVTENFSYLLVARPPREIDWRFEPIINLTEFFTAALNPFALSFIAQDIAVAEFALVNVERTIWAFENFPVTEYWAVERLEEGVFAQEYPVVTESLTISTYALLADDPCDSFLNIFVAYNLGQNITVTESRTLVVV